jgi:hypothetical protein
MVTGVIPDCCCHLLMRSTSVRSTCMLSGNALSLGQQFNSWNWRTLWGSASSSWRSRKKDEIDLRLHAGHCYRKGWDV